jgi:hypothetical protein
VACLPSTPVLAQATAPVPAAESARSAAAPAQQPVKRPSPPGASEPLATGEGRAVATKLADELLSNFEIHDSAVRYAAMLRANA